MHPQRGIPRVRAGQGSARLAAKLCPEPPPPVGIKAVATRSCGPSPRDLVQERACCRGQDHTVSTACPMKLALDATVSIDGLSPLPRHPFVDWVSSNQFRSIDPYGTIIACVLIR